MSSAAALQVRNLSHAYGATLAVDGISFDVPRSAIFGFLGPNGGGKTTLFSVLSTILPVQSGDVIAVGCDLKRQSAEYRRRIGVTFQAPSLDRRLTVGENMMHQGHLYGIAGTQLVRRVHELLEQFEVRERANDCVETLSGGLKRRVELAKCLIHSPELLLLDEPSTGLDPGARLGLWESLEGLREQSGTTIVVTTHLMEEAHRCDQLVLLDQGRIVGEGTPSSLRSGLSGQRLSIVAEQPDLFRKVLLDEFKIDAQRVGETLHVRLSDAQELLQVLMSRFGDDIREISVGKPTLEDVFLEKTGRRLRADS